MLVGRKYPQTTFWEALVRLQNDARVISWLRMATICTFMAEFLAIRFSTIFIRKTTSFLFYLSYNPYLTYFIDAGFVRFDLETQTWELISMQSKSPVSLLIHFFLLVILKNHLIWKKNW